MTPPTKPGAREQFGPDEVYHVISERGDMHKSATLIDNANYWKPKLEDQFLEKFQIEKYYHESRIQALEGELADKPSKLQIEMEALVVSSLQVEIQALELTNRTLQGEVDELKRADLMHVGDKVVTKGEYIEAIELKNAAIQGNLKFMSKASDRLSKSYNFDQQQIKDLESQLSALQGENEKWKNEYAGMARLLKDSVVIKNSAYKSYCALESENKRITAVNVKLREQRGNLQRAFVGLAYTDCGIKYQNVVFTEQINKLDAELSAIKGEA